MDEIDKFLWCKIIFRYFQDSIDYFIEHNTLAQMGESHISIQQNTQMEQ